MSSRFSGKACTAFFFLIFLILFAGVAQASMIHKVEVGDDMARVTSLLRLRSEEEVNSWKLTLDLPKNSEVTSIRDPRGNISYEREGGEILFETNSGPARREEVVKLNFTVLDVRDEKLRPLERVGLNLFGLPNETTKAEVQVDHPISWYTPFNFRSQRGDESLKFRGEGSLSVRIYASKKGQESKHYHYFEGGNISRAEDLFPLLPYFTGIQSPHNRFPILFLNDSRYDSLVNEWSSGRYRRGGLILVRSNLSWRNRVPTVLHETMHGFDSELLKWDQTKTAYLDEGMAKFVEFLVKQKMNAPQAEIFGDKVRFQRNDGIYYLEPRSSSQALWNYYRDGEDWMLRWNPWQETGRRAREFGYAYSELLIREYVQENGIKSLRNVSTELLRVGRGVDDWREKAQILSQEFGDLKPCYNQDRDEFNRCLEEINAQKFNLTDLNLNVSFKREGEKEINISEREFEIQPKEPAPRENLLSQLRSFLGFIGRRVVWTLKRL